MKIIILILLVIDLAGCSYLIVTKQCSKVADDSDHFVCRNIKPWE